jgi:hypothetical protein
VIADPSRYLKYLLSYALALLPLVTVAQQRCGTVEYGNKLRDLEIIQEDRPGFEQWMGKRLRERRQQFRTFRTQSTYRIPVVVHIIHNGEPVGTGTNIPDEQVISQIKVLNEDYQRLNTDAANTPDEFAAVAGSMDIEFVLARRTPEGLPTTGIVRVQGSKTSWTDNDDVLLKSQSYWPAKDYMNIWVCNLTNYLGYAQFPISDLPGLEDSPNAPLTDGVVLNHRVFGSNDYGDFDLDPDYNKGRSATHEIGHFFGLRHIWGDDGGGCGGDGDYVDDTPNQGGNSIGCPSHPRTSCTATNMFQNYLDYTDDVCMNLFTQGQVERMTIVLENSPRRASLLTSDGLSDPVPATTENLTLRSITAPVVSCATISDIGLRIKNNGVDISSFKVKITNGNEVSTVTFTGLNFLSGTEATFELNDVLLGTGKKTLTFDLIDPNGLTDTFPADNAASWTVVSDLARDVIPLKENFSTAAAGSWLRTNPTGGMLFTDINTNYDNSVYVNGFSNVVDGDQAWLVSPLLDFSEIDEASMFFDLSYGYRPGTSDNLKVLASTDCGQTFHITLFDKSGIVLSTEPTSASWMPASPGSWSRKYISLAALAHQPDARIAFVFTNNHGNNLYLDNIEFFASDNIDPVQVDKVFSVYPNPGKAGELNLTLDLPERSDIRIEMVDARGRILSSHFMQHALNQTLPLPMWDETPGMYFVRVITSGKIYNQKLILLQP